MFSSHILLLVLTPGSNLPDFTSHVLLSSYGQEPQGIHYEEQWGRRRAAQCGHSEEVTVCMTIVPQHDR